MQRKSKCKPLNVPTLCPVGGGGGGGGAIHQRQYEAASLPRSFRANFYRDVAFTTIAFVYYTDNNTGDNEKQRKRGRQEDTQCTACTSTFH